MPGQLLRETNPAQGYGPALVPQHEDVNGDYKSTGEKNPLPVSIEDSGGAAQTDVQYRKQKMFPIHAGVVVPNATANIPTTYLDTDGFHELSITATNSAAVSWNVDLHWSNDNVNTHTIETVVPIGTPAARGARVTTLARYVKVVACNNDASPRTMSTWAYLKV